MITRRKNSSVQASRLRDKLVKTEDVGMAFDNVSNKVDYDHCDAGKLSKQGQDVLNQTTDKQTVSSSNNVPSANQKQCSPSWEFKQFSQHKELFESRKVKNAQVESVPHPTNASLVSTEGEMVRKDSCMGSKINKISLNETKQIDLKKNISSLPTNATDNVNISTSVDKNSAIGDANLSDNHSTPESPEVIMRQVFYKGYFDIVLFLLSSRSHFDHSHSLFLKGYDDKFI